MGKLFQLLLPFVEKYIKTWFFEFDKESDEYKSRMKPIRVIITVAAVLMILVVIMKLLMPDRFSDTFVLTVVGNLGMLIGMDSWRSNVKDSNDSNNQN